MDDRIEQFADDATASLAADPELRLEARAGILAQLSEYQKSYRAAGHDEEESIEFALRSQCDPREISDKLLQANKQRMKTRRLQRVALRWILVPAALILAVLCWNRLLLHAYDFLPKTSDATGQPPPIFFFKTLQQRFDAATKADLFNHLGDSAAVFWLSDPHRIAHISYFLNSRFGYTDSPAQYRKLILIAEYAESLDPDNANYNYILACHLLYSAVKENNPRKGDPHRAPGNSYVIKNRLMLDRAMQEIAKGMANQPYDAIVSRLCANAWHCCLPQHLPKIISFVRKYSVLKPYRNVSTIGN